LLTSGSIATTATHALLSFGIIFELLGILVAICFLRCCKYSEDSHIPQPLPKLVRVISVVPIILILMGIIGLAAALVVEMLNTSLITAVAMTSVLIFGIILCLGTSHFGRR
jgi:cytochrome bd-type quinol oxidase subunit 2